MEHLRRDGRNRVADLSFGSLALSFDDGRMILLLHVRGKNGRSRDDLLSRHP